jgi:hypothetical protein
MADTEVNLEAYRTKGRSDVGTLSLIKIKCLLPKFLD